MKIDVELSRKITVLFFFFLLGLNMNLIILDANQFFEGILRNPFNLLNFNLIQH